MPRKLWEERGTKQSTWTKPNLKSSEPEKNWLFGENYIFLEQTHMYAIT